MKKLFCLALLLLMLPVIALADTWTCPRCGATELDTTYSFCGECGIDIRNKCGDNVYWALDLDGTLTVCGTGAMWDFEYDWSDNPWKDAGERILHLKVQPGVTRIGECAFNTLKCLLDAEISGTVKVIGKNAFQTGYAHLQTVMLEEGVEVLEQQAFDCCVGATVYLPDSMQEVEPWALMVKEIKVNPTNPHFQAKDHFLLSKDGKQAISFMLLDEDSEMIIDRVEVPAGVEVLKQGSLDYVLINTLVLPEGLVTMEDQSLSSFYLNDIYMPKSLKTIGSFCLHNVNKLPLTIHYAGTEAELNAISIGEYNRGLNTATILYNETW